MWNIILRTQRPFAMDSPKNKIIHENNPLNKLRNNGESKPNLKTVLDALPYNKLKELSNQLSE